MIVDNLKSWTNQCSMATRGTAQVTDARQNSFLAEAYGILKTGLLTLLKNGMLRLGKRIHEWNALAESVEDADMTFQSLDASAIKNIDLSLWKNAKGAVGTLLNINSCWRLWGAMGGAIFKIVHKLGSFAKFDDEDNDDQMLTVDDW
jgi:hypothetical protein